jgi:hypothetical protein
MLLHAVSSAIDTTDQSMEPTSWMVSHVGTSGGPDVFYGKLPIYR